VTMHRVDCIFCVQSVLRRRDAIQMEYDMLLEEMSRKKNDKDEVDMLFCHLKHRVTHSKVEREHR